MRPHSAIVATAFSLILLLACPCLGIAQTTSQVGIGVATERGYSPETGVLEDPLSAPLRWTTDNFPGPRQTIGVAAGASLARQTVGLGYWWSSIAGSAWSAGVAFDFDHELHQNVLQDLLGINFTDGQFGIAAPDPYNDRASWIAAMQGGQTIPSQYLMAYESWELGLGLTFGCQVTNGLVRLGVKGGIRSGLRNVQYNSGDYRPFEPLLRQDANRWVLIDRLYPTFYVDSRDSLRDTTSGLLLTQGVEYTGGLLLGERHSIRTDTAGEVYLPLVQKPVTELWDFVLVAAIRSAFSAILPQFAYWSPVANQTPTWGWFGPVGESSDLLHLDGFNTARGWTEKTGTHGAETMWNTKLELRMQLARKVLWAVAFADATGIWNTAGDIFPCGVNGFLYSVGAGFRLTTPWAPLRAYVVKAFQIGGGTTSADTQVFVLTLGGEVF